MKPSNFCLLGIGESRLIDSSKMARHHQITSTRSKQGDFEGPSDTGQNRRDHVVDVTRFDLWVIPERLCSTSASSAPGPFGPIGRGTHPTQGASQQPRVETKISQNRQYPSGAKPGKIDMYSLVPFQLVFRRCDQSTLIPTPKTLMQAVNSFIGELVQASNHFRCLPKREHS